jgi:hypothetical protein
MPPRIRFGTHQRPRQGFRQPMLQTRCRHNRHGCQVMPAIAAFRPSDHMTDDHGKGVFARALSQPLALWEASGPRLPGATQALLKRQSSPSNRLDPENLKIEAGTPLFPARRIFDLPNPYPAPRWKSHSFGSLSVFRLRAGRFAKTQKWLRSALRVMSGVWWPRRADSPADVFESWRGMSP